LSLLKITLGQTQRVSGRSLSLAAKSLEFQTPCHLERMMGTVFSPKFAPHPPLLLSQKCLMITLWQSSTALNWKGICPRLFLRLQLQTTLSLMFPKFNNRGNSKYTSSSQPQQGHSFRRHPSSTSQRDCTTDCTITDRAF
jgi:hypothetical protein